MTVVPRLGQEGGSAGKGLVYHYRTGVLPEFTVRAARPQR